MTAPERRTLVYGVSILAMVFLFWPYVHIVDAKKSIILHLMARFPLMLLGDTRLHLDELHLNFVDDFLAIALNPGFVSGAIIGRYLVRDWTSTVKALFPVMGASLVILFIGAILSAITRGGGDMAGLWVIGPMATIVFWPFAWAGAVAGWKGGEFYERQTGNPNHPA